MNKKPIQIIIVALLLMFDPFVNIVINALYFHIKLSTALGRAWMNLSWHEKAVFFFLGPTLAFSVYSVKRWSVPVSVICVLLAVRENFYEWSRFPNQISIVHIIGVCIAQLAIIYYILLPQVRLFYFNRKVRWWENKPRYEIGSETTFTYADKSYTASTLNFSEGGVFLITNETLKVGEKLNLILDQVKPGFNFTGVIVHGITLRGQKGFGIRFEHNSESKKVAKNYAAELKRKNIPSSNPPRNIREELVVLWASLKKGKGLVPSFTKPVNTAPRESEKISKAA